MRDRDVLISGGGTGGHIYPALAVGRKLRERNPQLQLTYLGTKRDVERKIMDAHGVRFVPMAVEGLKGKGWRSLKSLALLPAAFVRTLFLLRKYRPGLVIGAGGYSSGPVVLLAAWSGIPTLILEQNVRPGLTNRLLLRWVKKAVAAFESSLPLLRGKGVFLGNPVREEFYGVPRRASRPELAVLVFGGSQGSRFLNERVTAALPLLADIKDRLRFLHQTGESDAARVESRYREEGFMEAVVTPYIRDMARAFGEADIVLSRAGATTCAELIAARKASLLIPFARAAENHQEWNAGELHKAGGAEVLTEGRATAEELAGRIRFYLDNKDRLDEMGRKLNTLRTEGAADRIAALALELMGGRA